jgi:hypothetical protein
MIYDSWHDALAFVRNLNTPFRQMDKHPMQEQEWYHANFNTPGDLSLWLAELDGDVNRP